LVRRGEQHLAARRPRPSWLALHPQPLARAEGGRHRGPAGRGAGPHFGSASPRHTTDAATAAAGLTVPVPSAP